MLSESKKDVTYITYLSKITWLSANIFFIKKLYNESISLNLLFVFKNEHQCLNKSMHRNVTESQND